MILGGRNMNKKSTGLLLSVLGVISLVLITAGVTYAFFTYAKEGKTVNTVTTGTITFLYTEGENGINITDALPTSDDTGKALTGENNVFDFNVTSTVAGNIDVPYIVTVKKDAANSTIADNNIKIYLTSDDSTGTNYTVNNDDSVKTFAELTAPDTKIVNLTSVNADAVVEKLAYSGTVPANTKGYTNNLTLRMWLNGDSTGSGTGTVTDYSPYEFVKISAVSGTDPLNADALITSGELITSTAYYAMDDTNRALYERIAYVNKTARTIITVSQVTAGATATDGFEASEQFYQINGGTFKVKVNVYANASVVQAGD